MTIPQPPMLLSPWLADVARVADLMSYPDAPELDDPPAWAVEAHDND